MSESDNAMEGLTTLRLTTGHYTARPHFRLPYTTADHG
jgi:hypothetical protein